MKNLPFATPAAVLGVSGVVKGRNGPPLTRLSVATPSSGNPGSSAPRARGQSDHLVLLELLAEAIGGMVAMKEVTSVAVTSLRQHENLGSLVPGRWISVWSTAIRSAMSEKYAS